GGWRGRVGSGEPGLVLRRLGQAREARRGDGVARERLARRGVDDGRGEVAGQLVRVGHAEERAEPALDAGAVVVDEEERLVLDDGSGDNTAELLLAERRLRLVGGIVVVRGVEAFHSA